MSDGGHKGDYTYPDKEDDLDWWAECRMNIQDVRSVYSSIDYYLKIWPGEPDRPEGEKQFLENFKGNMFRMITDYNYTHHIVEETVEEVDTSTTDDA